MGGAHTWVSGAVQVVEHLPAEISGDQGPKRPRGGVAEEVKVTNLLRDDAQLRAGVEGLHLWAEDLAECHVPELEGGLLVMAAQLRATWRWRSWRGVRTVRPQPR